MSPDLLPSRIAAKIAVDHTGCWCWLSYRNPKGYGKLGGDMAHRRIFELLVGPIPEGLQIDHLCRVRHCVNPDHMDLVTNRTNVLRGTSPAAIAYHTDICVAGLHPLTGDNVILRTTRGRMQRQCRACRWEAYRRWQLRNRHVI